MNLTRLFCCFWGLFTGFTCWGQNIQLYNADYLPQSLLMNPGVEVEYDYHFGIPLLSGIHAGFGSTEITVNDIFRNDPSTTINDRIEQAISSVSRNDYFSVDQHLEILSAGWRNRKGNYLSAGWYQETNVIAYFPKDPAILAYEGNSGNLGKSFDLGDLSARGEVVSVLHFGINKRVSKNLSIGGRAKIYSSMFNATSTGNKGLFSTTRTPDGNNIFRHNLRGLDASFKMSGVEDFRDLETSDVISSSLFGGNYGLGVDVGFSYKLDRQWQLTASLVDLGFIFHSNKTREIYANGNYEFDGIGFIYPTVTEPNDEPPYYDQLVNDFKANVSYGNETDITYTTMRPLKFYSSLEYRFGESTGFTCLRPSDNSYRFRTGLTLFAINRPRLPQASLTGYFDARLLNFLHTKVTYTVDPYTATNLGFLVSAQIAKFNLYISADNMLGYENLAKSNTIAFQFGMQFVFNSKK
ncbi:DUF5723 family protein [Flavimarina sp. Hel_I_48]|uniref:DUF5723 family protein n=1 Tax=Flavimarina sp. Hel_I_48 TaxID=1392488 RepID=UPI00068C4C80|nr:DUF5723 family protein [Flavimarina sp. Hel_I_48]